MCDTWTVFPTNSLIHFSNIDKLHELNRFWYYINSTLALVGCVVCFFFQKHFALMKMNMNHARPIKCNCEMSGVLVVQVIVTFVMHRSHL